MAAAVGKNLDLDESELLRASTWAKRYRIVLHQLEDGNFVARGLELPGAIVTRVTADQAVSACRHTMTVAVAVLLREGGRPPVPAVEQKLDEQVNFRVTREDRLRIEDAAHTAGYRGVSEYVRNAVLSRVNGG